MKQTIFRSALFLLMMAAMMPMRAEIYSGDCGAQGDNVKWELNTETGELTISGNGEMKDSPIRSLWEDKSSSILTVKIYNGVTSIGDCAFFYCSNLASIMIPESVESIGDYAFQSCSNLLSITIPEGVTHIGTYPFDGCYFTTGSFINNSFLSDEYNWGATIVDERTEDGFCIKDNVIVKYLGNASHVDIPNTIVGIGDNAFSSCYNLASITIPESVTSIGNYVFAYCSLSSITIPESVTSIGYYPFENCYFTKESFINKSSLYDENNWGATFVDERTEDGLCINEHILVKCIGTASCVEIPNTVTSIGDMAFMYCDHLVSITIPEGVTSIGEDAFRDCANLTSITLPESLKSIGPGAFIECNYEA